MAFPQPVAITDTSAWLVKDEAWVASRKEQWRAFGPAMKVIQPTAAEARAVERYYLTGKQSVPQKWHDEFPSLALFFRLWMHPDDSEENWRAQTDATVWEDYNLSRSLVWGVAGDNGPGLTNGLEERLYEWLFGGEDTRRFLDIEEYRYGRIAHQERNILGQRGMPGIGIDVVARILCFKEKSSIALARYQLRDWLRRPEHEQWIRYAERPEAGEKLQRLFHLVRHRASEDAASESTPGQIEIAKEFEALFDSGAGPQVLLEAWKAHGANDEWKAKARTRLF